VLTQCVCVCVWGGGGGVRGGGDGARGGPPSPGLSWDVITTLAVAFDVHPLVSDGGNYALLVSALPSLESLAFFNLLPPLVLWCPALPCIDQLWKKHSCWDPTLQFLEGLQSLTFCWCAAITCCAVLSSAATTCRVWRTLCTYPSASRYACSTRVPVDKVNRGGCPCSSVLLNCFASAGLCSFAGAKQIAAAAKHLQQRQGQPLHTCHDK
jgi:hypothetical protein